MHVVLVGMSHKTAPVSIREKLALNEKDVLWALTELKGYTVVEEVVILSTCNRTEFYVNTPSPYHAEQALCEFIRTQAPDLKNISAFLYRKRDRDACQHLFEVASSLDSQVVGESQILGQVKKALNLACAKKTARDNLTMLFERALIVAQAVRAQSGIGQGSVSIGSVGVQLVKEVLGDLTNKIILLLGAGEVGKLVVKYLNGEKVRETWIVNRTEARTRMLEEQGLGISHPFHELKDLIQKTDVLIAAIDGKIGGVSYYDLNAIALSRKERPLLVIDLGVPRTFVERQTKRPHLHVLTLDDLQAIANQNQKTRLKAIALAKKLIDREVDVLYGKTAQVTKTPTPPRLARQNFLISQNRGGEHHG